MSYIDEFGTRMKDHEAVETTRKFDVLLPIYCRVDGRGFSKFTRGMQKPCDARMTSAMIETARHLVEATQARIGFVQSDEISLVWQADSPESDVFFSGKIQKMVSVIASMAAAKFASVCPEGFEDRLPHFDARVFQLPSRTETANVILWRAMDAKRNAVSMAAQHHFSHSSLQGKNQKEMLALLEEARVDFDAYPVSFRQGTFLRRETRLRDLTPEEMATIPEQYRPTAPVLRSSVEIIDMPRFDTVTNREEVVFDGAAPCS